MVLTLFLTMAKVEEEILLRSVPRTKGDLAIAQRPKCRRSSFAFSLPLPTICMNCQYGDHNCISNGLSTHQHVEVVKPTRSRVLRNVLRAGTDAHDRSPVTPVVSRHPPRVTHALSPLPNIVATPVAQVEVDVLGTFNTGNGVTHRGVPRLRIALGASARLRQRISIAGSVAIVVLPEINVPGGECLSILILMALGTGVPGACLCTGAAVKSKFETHAVDFLGH